MEVGRILPTEAAVILNVSPQFIRIAMQQGKRVVSGILRGTGNKTGQNHGQTDIFHFVGIGGGDMDRSSVHTGFYIHYVSDR